MRNVLKNIALTTVFLLYCFLLSNSSSNVLYPSNTHSTKTEQHYTFQQSDISGYIGHNESSFRTHTNVPSSSKRTTDFSFSNYIKVVEKLIFHQYLQYNFYSTNVAFLLAKHCILYPFHYFW